MRKQLVVVLASALGLFGLAGCAVEDYATDNNSPVIFRIADINGGSPLSSDVLGDGGVVSDRASVTLAVRPKNQNFSNVPQVPMAVFVERYEIRYYRSDGRAVPGVDVPYTISGNLTTVVDAGTGSGENVSVELEMVRAQAKLEPPLVNLRGGGQAVMITIFAELTLHGHTVAGEAVKSTGVLQVNFADYAGATP